MAPPSALWYVEWNAARRRDRPNDRRLNRRTYWSQRAAARQVSLLILNEHYGTHLSIVGVWRVVDWNEHDGLEWSPYYGPAFLPMNVVPTWDDDPSDTTSLSHQETA